MAKPVLQGAEWEGDGVREELEIDRGVRRVQFDDEASKGIGVALSLGAAGGMRAGRPGARTSVGKRAASLATSS